MTTRTATSALAEERHPTMAAVQMRAATIDRYGPPEVVESNLIDRPSCKPDEVVVAVRAASVNPYDWHMMTGTPLVTRLGSGWKAPRSRRLGVDVAGVIESVGENSDRFSVGDEVFGFAAGAFAEYVSAKDTTLVHKPANISFEEAAGAPVAALTALQGLRDHGGVEAGHHVLINGASGGVGTYAVQLAKHLGAEVTGVCSGRNVALVRGLGADHVVDYTAGDFTEHAGTYDLIIDNIGNRALSDYKRCLSDAGTYVVVGAPKGRVLGPLSHMIKALIYFAFGKQRAAVFMAQQTLGDLELISELFASGNLRSVIDAVYPMSDMPEALTALETGRTRGKIVITPHA